MQDAEDLIARLNAQVPVRSSPKVGTAFFLFMFALLCLAFLIGAVFVGCSHQTQPPETSRNARSTQMSGFYEKVRALALRYAAEKSVPLLNTEAPTIVVLKTHDDLAKVSGLPLKSGNALLHGATIYDEKTIYVVGWDYEVLVHELGHWFLSVDCAVADDFTDYVLKGDQ